MAARREIDIEEVRTALNLILDNAVKLAPDGKLPVHDDELLYWSLPSRMAFDMTTDPTGSFSGNVMDDYEFLQSVIGYDDEGIDVPVLMMEHAVGVMLLLAKKLEG